MSVRISELQKTYGDQKALAGISFEALPGGITGFLGPNGAGKSTTMKILSGFLDQDGGTATVCGFDTRSQAEEVKRRIGYLPEHNPLYKDMYVKEYLGFVAGMHSLDKRKQRVADMVELTGLGREQHKKINALSKGYRQRVGLAQALIHDPEVLILDEPTSGLDPNQLADIRELIRGLGQEKTVILSTHIMQEVEALCDKVVIINQGEIVADGALDSLKQQAGKSGIDISIEFAEEFPLDERFKDKAVMRFSQGNSKRNWTLTVNPEKDLRGDLFRFAVENDLTLLGLSAETREVEDIFRYLTHK